MGKCSSNYLALGFLLTVTLNNISIPALANSATVTSPKTTLHVYNYAPAPPKVLARAEEETTIIFGEAGVLTLWLDCPISMAEFDRYPACQQPSGPADLILRILPRSMAEREPPDDSTLGFALPGRPGAPGPSPMSSIIASEKWPGRGNTLSFRSWATPWPTKSVISCWAR